MTKQDTIRGLLDAGLTYFGLGQVQKALEAWNQVLSMEPHNAKAKQYIDFVHNNWEPPSNVEEELIRSDKMHRPQGIESHQPVRPGETKIGSSSLPSYPSADRSRHESATPIDEINPDNEIREEPKPHTETTPSEPNLSPPALDEPPESLIHSDDFWSIDHPPTNPGNQPPDIWAPLKSEDFQGLTLPSSEDQPRDTSEPDPEPTGSPSAVEDVFEEPDDDLLKTTETPFEKPVMEDDIVTTEASLDPDDEDQQDTTEAILDMVADSMDINPADTNQPEPNPPPVSSSDLEIQNWIKGARELLAMDDFTNSLELAEKVLSRDANHPEAMSIQREAESSLLSLLSSKLGDLQRTPAMGMKDDEIIWLNLDHQAGFVLSLIDGQMNLEEIMSVSNLKPLAVMRILTQLLQDNIIKL